MILRRSAAALAAAALALPAAAQVAQQPRVLAPGDNLVIDGVPPIPEQLVEEVRRYTEYRSAGLADWHPTRREMLISTRFGNTNQVHHVRAPGGARHQLTFFSEPVGGTSYEPLEGRYFLFTRDVGGNEFAQLYRYDLADGRTTMLTDGGRSQNGGVVWSRKGDRIAYNSTRRSGGDRDLYVMDPANPRSDRMVMQAQGGGWGVGDWSPDDARLAVVNRTSINQSHIHLLDLATGQRTQLTPAGNDTTVFASPRFTPDGRGMYLITDLGREFRTLAHMDLGSRQITPLTADVPWDVDGYDLSPDGRTIAFVTNEAGVSRLHLLDTSTRRHRPVAGVPTGVVGGGRWHPNGDEFGFSVSSARSPSDVYSLEVASGQITRWTESELGGVVASALVEPELARWTSFDGREITGFLYRPPARFTGKRPVIIDIHGGPEGQSRPEFLGRDNYWVNELGVALIFPNVRGSTGYGKTFLKLDNGMRREDSVKDIAALLDWIARQPGLDAGRVMVTGGSYGGYMTLAVATQYNDRICCSVDIVGISDFNTFLRNTESYRRDLRRAEYGDERDPAMAEFFRRIAPLGQAGNITKPLFVVQGGNDPRVPRTEAEQMVARVKQNGSPVWFLMAMDEGHGFRKKSNADYLFYATVMFVRQHLLGEAPATARATAQ